MWCGKGNVNVCFGRLFWQACNGNVCSHKTASPKPFCLSTVSSNWTRIRVLWSSVCTPHCNPHWLVDKQQYKSDFDIVVLVTKRPLSCGTISYELPGAAAAIRRGTRAVPASLVCMVILPHSSGSKWCCDSTKSAAAMSSFLQVPLYFPQSRNNLLSCAPSSPFSLAQMRASLFSHASYGAVAWCSSSLVLWFCLHTGRLSSVRLILSVYDYSLFKCKCTE